MTTKVVLAGLRSIGKYVAEEFLKYKDEFQLIILSRKENKPWEDKGATVIVVDFENVEQISEALKGTDVVINLLGVGGEDLYKSSSVLLQASKNAAVKRFIPNEWVHDASYSPALLPHYQRKYDWRKVIEESGLEYSLVGVGIIMEYLLPQDKRKYARDFARWVIPYEKTACIPGTGDEIVTLTASEDIAKGTVALVRFKGKWPKYFRIVGERTSWNKVLETAERVTGQKFNVERRSVEQLKEIHATAEDFWTKTLASTDIAVAQGLYNVPECKESEEILKNIKFISVEELLRTAY